MPRWQSGRVSREPPGILVFAQLGLVGAFMVLATGALGWWVDTELGTLPLFLLVGLVAGAVGAGATTWREVRKRM